MTISGIVNLPYGLEFAPILQYGSARPYDLRPGYDTLNFGSGDTRAVVVPIADKRNFTSYAAPSTAAAARACYFSGQCTIAQYDPLRGDPFFQTDVRLAENIKLGEVRKLQLIFQAFNLTNHANYGNNFGTNINSTTFKHPVGFINPSSTSIPRSFSAEFGARFSF